MITIATLIAAGICPSLARSFETPLQEACALYEINTPLRQAAFIAQCGHESLGFSHLEENLWYSRAETIRSMWPSRVINLAVAQSLVGQPQELANTVYAGRYGNGDKLSGDGWAFIGRGLIQVTFRDTYRECGVALGRPYEDFPALLAKPDGACRSAAWYWASRHLNALADTGSVESVTRVINPAMVGIDDRRRRYAAATVAFA